MKNLLLPLLFFCTITNAQSWADTAAMIDKIFSRYVNESPGAQLAISHNGEIIYSSARGMANLEYNVPLTRTSRIEAGSVSKQFTAAAVLLLQQQGKLSLSDDIRKYVPEIRDYGTPITIRHLMNHTSGLKDWGSIAELSGWPRGTKAYRNEDALQFIIQQKTLNNKPGDEFIYSNSNYNLMAIIVQRVSGISLADFTKKFIFEPADMKNTEWRDNFRKVVPNRATAYSKIGAEYITNMPNENAYGNGGLLTTAEDLITWNNYYLSGKLGTSSLLSFQTETKPFNNGKRNAYAGGLFVDSLRGWRIISHDGATAGYRSNLEHFPQLGLSIAWLSNNSLSSLGDVPFSVRNLLVKNLLPIPSPLTPVKGIDFKTFIPYLGAYRESRLGSGVKLYMKNDSIYSETNGGPLPALGVNSLAVGRGRILFLSSSPRTIRFITASGDTLLYNGVDSARLDEKAMTEYTGNYFSEEADTKITIKIKDGKLGIYRSNGSEAFISPIYKDGFYFPGGDLYFERDKNGKISHFFISISRARKVNFIKMKEN
jgi:CubicO group peptidase (beta-lactamase class C family)